MSFKAQGLGRSALRGVVCVVGLVGMSIGTNGPGTALANNAIDKNKDDGASQADHSVFVTPSGSYLTLDLDNLSGERGKAAVYFGDGRELFRQRVLITSVDEDDNVSILVWAPKQPRDATIEVRDERWFLRCGESEVALTEVTADERAVLLRTAKFRKPRFSRVAYALARNEKGEYFYIDREVGARGNVGFRLFSGRSGRVSRQKLRWVVSDSEGDVFATARGQMRVTRPADGQKLFVWQRKKQQEPLLEVPIGQNSFLIYKQLGVYENQDFGTPCDTTNSSSK